MSLPNFRQIMPASPAHNMQSPMTNGGSPVSFNILKDRLKSNQAAGMAVKDDGKSSPFIMGQNGNSAFNPLKLGARLLSSHGTPKPPKAPEKPLMPYMRYSRKVWDQVKNQNPELKFVEIGKIIGAMWRGLSEDERSEYTEEYETEKMDFERKMAAYKNTPAFQAYMQAKSKGAPIIEDPEPKGLRAPERRIDIQPAEDEEDPDDGLSVKHIAHARFVRNHCLINEIFSEVMVPDVRNVVTTNRMQVLKRQVQSLTMHQKKLESELSQIEDKYNAKKRKLQETSEDFGKELKKHCDQPVDDQKYKELITEQMDKLRVEREERARAGASTPPSPLTLVEPFENRNVLKPVERSEDPESPDNNMETSMLPEKILSSKNGGLDMKAAKDAKTSNEKTEYAEMINQRPPSQSMMTPLAKAPTDMGAPEHVSCQAAPGYPVPSGGLPTQQGYPVPMVPHGVPAVNAHPSSGNGPVPIFPNAPIHMGVPGGLVQPHPGMNGVAPVASGPISAPIRPIVRARPGPPARTGPPARNAAPARRAPPPVITADDEDMSEDEDDLDDDDDDDDDDEDDESD